MSEQPHSEDWKQEAPKLASLPKKEPFEAPEGYFDQLADRVMASIESEALPAKRRAPSFARRWLPFAATAAVAAICLIMLWPAGEEPEGPAGPWVQAMQPDIPALSNAELAMAIDREAVAVEEIYEPAAHSTGQAAPQPSPVEKMIEKDIQELPTQEMEDYLQDLPLDELESLL